jgi:monomeric isocitrate dehydrogenase
VKIDQKIKNELYTKIEEAKISAQKYSEALEALRSTDIQILKMIERFLKTQNLSPAEAKIISDREKARLDLEGVKGAGK